MTLIKLNYLLDLLMLVFGCILIGIFIGENIKKGIK
jgi:hypothetical protein